MWFSLYPPALFLLQTDLCEATALTVRPGPQAAPGASSSGRVVGGEGSAWGQVFTPALSQRGIDLNAVKKAVTDGVARITNDPDAQTYESDGQTYDPDGQADASDGQA
jgi:hypothetical protein